MPNLSFGEKVARNAWRLAPKRFLSRMIGWGARRRLPRRLQLSLLRSYARAYRLNTTEAERPMVEYASLQAFFTRRLAAGLRALPDDPMVVVSPSDGTVCDLGIAEAGKLLEAKGSAFTLVDFLADEELAQRFVGGAYLVVYLSPRDYHRVHFPVGGKVIAWHHIPGQLFPVGPRSVRREPGLFAKNERFVTILESPAGLCAVGMVAAVGVGHITASFDDEVATHAKNLAANTLRHKRYDTPIPVERGQELGIFNLGSTTVTIFEPGRVNMDSLTTNGHVQMGYPIGRMTVR